MLSGFLNTPYSGSVRSVIFQEGSEWFGAALEFNIIESGDSPEEVSILLDNAIKGYVEAAQKSKLSMRVLNQEIDPEYEALWKHGDTAGKQDGKTVYKTSSQPLAALAT
jgi:predicted RNase H-like HicB family nuclease